MIASVVHANLIDELMRLEQTIGERPAPGARTPRQRLPFGGCAVRVPDRGGAVEWGGAVVLLEQHCGGQGVLPDQSVIVLIAFGG